MLFAQINRQGTLQWALPFDGLGTGAVYANGVAVGGADGSVFVVGSTNSSEVSLGNAWVLNHGNAGTKDVFLVKVRV